jgi:ligand-binding sensor domain-containing protein
LLHFGSLKAFEYNSYSFNALYDFEYNTIYDIREDQNRNMWFGSSRGLVQFDGKNFKQYNTPGVANGLTLIHFGPAQQLWCVNFGGQIFRLNDDSLEIILEESYDGNFISSYKILT